VRGRLQRVRGGHGRRQLDVAVVADRVTARAGRRPRGLEQLGHETDVGDGQPERLDSGQALLVRERRRLAPQLVERLVQVVHAPALAYVGRAPLRQRGHPPPDLLRRRGHRRLLRTTASVSAPAQTREI